jgi:transcription antitermination factor NusG
VRDRLFSKGVEPLLPLVRHIRQWSDRKQRVDLPLFAGYCFAKFSLHDRISVLEVPGVVNIVGITAPEPIPDEEILSLNKLLDSRLTYREHPYFVQGDPVRVVRGPLTGLTGQFVRESGQGYIVIRIHLIQQAAAVHVNLADCEAVA